MSRKEALVRETKRKTLSLIHNVSGRVECGRIRALLERYDSTHIENRAPEKVRTITFIVTRMVRYHGGQTSVLHLGTELEKLGVKVSYLSYKPQSVEEMKICAESNLPEYRGRLYPFNRYMAAIKAGKISEPDVIVATSWDTVSFAKKFEKSYKMYFVQDYEPLFYNFGEEYLMCRDTYLQGLHMVSLGSWNKYMIERECPDLLIDDRTTSETADEEMYAGRKMSGAADADDRMDNLPGTSDTNDGTDSLRRINISVIDFPCDKSGYLHFERDWEAYRNKKKLTIAVYLKYYGKRLPNLIPYMLINTSEKLKREGIELEVLYFGEAKTFSAPGGRNLGQLSKAEMNELYHRADFGMVASMSNISLVPYEMHAAGLPVIEFADGTYPFFFGKETALLTRIGERDIADLLLDAVKNPQKLSGMDKKAGGIIEKLGWERSGRQFLEAIPNIMDV